MQVFRISRTKYARDLKGEGARLFGGRWNPKGLPCIYASATRALSLLEYSVNSALDEIPRSLSITVFEINEALIHTISIEELPGNWQISPSPDSTRRFGARLFTVQRAPIIKIPSAILPEEYNYLLNPLLLSPDDFHITDVRDFAYDIRIKFQ